MDNNQKTLESQRKLLSDAQARGGLAPLGAFLKLSGPGWLQSAITLGGGSLAGARGAEAASAARKSQKL